MDRIDEILNSDIVKLGLLCKFRKLELNPARAGFTPQAQQYMLGELRKYYRKRCFRDHHSEFQSLQRKYRYYDAEQRRTLFLEERKLVEREASESLHSDLDDIPDVFTSIDEVIEKLVARERKD